MNAPNTNRFFAEYRRQFGALRAGQVQPLENLLGFMARDPALLDIRYAAYMLATTYHETAFTFEPVREGLDLSEAWRKKNLRYFPFYGRGFVQLTWEANYRKASALVGEDLVANPDAAMKPISAYRIMSWGMREGWFTGKKLADYLTDVATDYVGARRIINGTDRAARIAAYAEKFERCLGAGTFTP